VFPSLDVRKNTNTNTSNNRESRRNLSEDTPTTPYVIFVICSDENAFKKDSCYVAFSKVDTVKFILEATQFCIIFVTLPGNIHFNGKNTVGMDKSLAP